MKEKRRRVRVVEPYAAIYPDPLRASKGEPLDLGKRDDEYPGWIWCTDSRGKSGWTPEAYLEVRGDRAILLRDYDARELTVNEGDMLIVEDEEAHWLFCVTKSGKRGWIARRNTEVMKY